MTDDMPEWCRLRPQKLCETCVGKGTVPDPEGNGEEAVKVCGTCHGKPHGCTFCGEEHLSSSLGYCCAKLLCGVRWYAARGIMADKPFRDFLLEARRVEETLVTQALSWIPEPGKRCLMLIARALRAEREVDLPDNETNGPVQVYCKTCNRVGEESCEECHGMPCRCNFCWESHKTKQLGTPCKQEGCLIAWAVVQLMKGNDKAFRFFGLEGGKGEILRLYFKKEDLEALLDSMRESAVKEACRAVYERNPEPVDRDKLLEELATIARPVSEKAAEPRPEPPAPTPTSVSFFGRGSGSKVPISSAQPVRGTTPAQAQPSREKVFPAPFIPAPFTDDISTVSIETTSSQQCSENSVIDDAASASVPSESGTAKNDAKESDVRPRKQDEMQTLSTQRASQTA